MSRKIELQLLGEDFTSCLYCSKGYSILGRNIRRAQYEFDIVCKKCNQVYVVEVRTTEQLIIDLRQIFPIKKLLTLLYGTQHYYPTAQITCVLVNARNTLLQYQLFNITDLL